MVVRFVRPALSPISLDDHSGYLWIATILGVIYTFVVALARFYVKFRILGTDDYILGLATVRQPASHILSWTTDEAACRYSIYFNPCQYSLDFQTGFQNTPTPIPTWNCLEQERYVLIEFWIYVLGDQCLPLLQ